MRIIDRANAHPNENAHARKRCDTHRRSGWFQSLDARPGTARHPGAADRDPHSANGHDASSGDSSGAAAHAACAH